MEICLKCHRTVNEHQRWTADNIIPLNVSPKCIGRFIGHDPLTHESGYVA